MPGTELTTMNIEIKDLLDAGVHFGHQTRRWNPRSKPYVFAHRHGVSIIDLEKTFALLEKAAQFAEDTVAKGGNILILGTKKQAQDILREMGTACNMPFVVSRWLGGTLTNFATVKKSLDKYRRYLKMEADGSLDKLPKKEASVIRHEMARMQRNFEGLLDLNKLPDALFVVDTKNEAIAVAEGNRCGIPVVALVDTNSDPTLVQYPIPGNDDAVKSIRLICDVLTEAVQNGLARRPAKVAEKVVPAFVAPEVSDVEPEVTIAADIKLGDADEKSAAKKLARKPVRARAKKAPAKDKAAE